MSEGGVKFDQQKLPFHLLPPEMLEETAKVLEFGANKYTVEYETEWDRLLSAPDVVGLSLTTATTTVVVVTKKNSDELILNSQNDNDKIVGIGKNVILTKLRNTPNVGNLIQKLVSETPEPNGLNTFLNLDLMKSATKTLLNKGVVSADQKNIFILTIATTRGNFEASFVQNATTDLDFWGVLWRDLEKQLNILKPLNKTGARNWELGMDWSRVFSALMRHMWAWWRKEDKDPETGFSHLSHALCCLAFLSAYERRNTGKDDRP